MKKSITIEEKYRQHFCSLINNAQPKDKALKTEVFLTIDRIHHGAAILDLFIPKFAQTKIKQIDNLLKNVDSKKNI